MKMYLLLYDQLEARGVRPQDLLRLTSPMELRLASAIMRHASPQLSESLAIKAAYLGGKP